MRAAGATRRLQSRLRFQHAASALLLLVSIATAPAIASTNFGVDTRHYFFRVEWEPEGERGVGYVHNLHPGYFARWVVLRIDAFDAAGSVVLTRRQHVLGHIPNGWRQLFAFPLVAGAASHRVEVESFTWHDPSERLRFR